MKDIWMVVSILLFILLVIMVVYHIYYRINIRNITSQLDDIIGADTNQLLTIAANQKDITKLVNKLNNLIKSVRLSIIDVKRINRNFRESITNISHDVRTPLTTLGGYVQMLQDEDVTEEEKNEYIDIIAERENMVKMLLEQLFEYVRIESGEITYEHEKIDAKRAFVETLAVYYDDFNNKGEEPIVITPERPCIVLGDEKGIRRIFSNILYNASIHGCGRFTFEVKESDKYTFIFSNDSEPMTNEDLDNIFERFYTKDKSRNKKTTGLGLTIAKQITKQLNGDIEAYYNNGRFSIEVSFLKIKY
ncbi:MAG: HAMP domain-containing sensor histidine kinase [Inconstantimicrobium porci]|uniref:sensor histidine kinase n=1 Tax=Inconstantimicrobium porci TaxID=2652291 RepID=UPI002A91658C|nr:HAMP domain-containing sensor histidine kinase [Inconstantimicrobium porci]MDY5910670.1 HAMP domain-containing sensor histidine kinase [Inconstantimicrobium porci]